MTEKVETVEEEVKKPTTRRTVKKVVEKTPEQLENEKLKKELEEMKKLMAEQAKALEKKPEPKVATRLPNDYLVSVRSITTGRVNYLTREGIPYTWEAMGVVHDLPMSEIRFIRSAKPAFFTNGWLFIEDEEVVNELRLNDVYAPLIGNLDFEKLLIEQPIEKLEKLLTNAPKGVGVSIGYFALQLMREKKLADFNKINLIQKITGLDLKLYME